MLPHHVIPHADAVSRIVEFEIHRDELSFCEESHSLRLQKQVVAFRRSKRVINIWACHWRVSFSLSDGPVSVLETDLVIFWGNRFFSACSLKNATFFKNLNKKYS
jgi:hypothetical protein